MRFRGFRRVSEKRAGSERASAAAARPGAGVGVIRKNRAMAVGLGAVILSSLVSWGAATRIRSPAEVAARTAPPTPSAITVPVVKRVVVADVVVWGTVRYGPAIWVVLRASRVR